MKVLIACGPTREYLDQVRCLTNRSTGLFGVELAQEALFRSHCVTLISGTKEVMFPGILYIETTNELLSACRALIESHDILVMNAAVCDYKAGDFYEGKLQKQDEFSLRLVENVDVLKQLLPYKTGRVFVGFALEEEDGGRERALAKLKTKQLDLIVYNRLDSIGSGKITGSVISTHGEAPFNNLDKRQVSALIFDQIEKLTA